ncbi:4a-hydroxytetrahydrobiopterin dehydratase [Alienimonas sp. DA493]|uniref:4a-hydroxytetrahydrobiopterin dehydratase n=1 Tax=Alienimonas sp. DA493 TaxID=3373605 RepID=UPI003754EE49
MADAAPPTLDSLKSGHCKPCEGGVPTLSRGEVAERLKLLTEWETTDDGDAIRREWNVGSFSKGLAFFDRVGEIAEAEGHHPDLHLTGYRHAAIVLKTHAVGGLTENDFILAAKIDALGDPREA